MLMSDGAMLNAAKMPRCVLLYPPFGAVIIASMCSVPVELTSNDSWAGRRRGCPSLSEKPAQRSFFLNWRANRPGTVDPLRQGSAPVSPWHCLGLAMPRYGRHPGMVGSGDNQNRAGSAGGRVSSLFLFSQCPIHVCPAYSVDGAALSSSQSIDGGRKHARSVRRRKEVSMRLS